MHSRIFNDYMATRRRGRQRWFDTYPVDRELSSALPNSDSNLQKESSILLVDVGGNRGHDLIALKSNHPNLAGKMILQDLPEVVANAEFDLEDDNRLEAMAHDFFEPQPIRRIDSLHRFSPFVSPVGKSTNCHDPSNNRRPRISFPRYLPRLARRLLPSDPFPYRRGHEAKVLQITD